MMSSYFHGEAKNDSPFTRQIVKPRPPVAPVTVTPAGTLHNVPGPPDARGSNGNGDGIRGAQTGAKTNASKAPAASPFDLSTDPIVQRIRALNTRNYGDAISQADSVRKQALINAGFSDIARSAQFGSLEQPTTGDEATALAAAANPYSVAANLKLAHDQAQNQIDQNANHENLFFSSARANRLGDEAHQYLGNVSGAEGALRNQLTDIISGLLSARSQGAQSEADALSTARTNAITRALAMGQSFLGYDDNGNPIFGNGDTTANDSSANDTSTTPPPVTPPAVSTYGAPQTSTFGGSAGPYISGYPTSTPVRIAKPRPKLPNAYLTNPNKRG